jgi:hypothetical protein
MFGALGLRVVEEASVAFAVGHVGHVQQEDDYCVSRWLLYYSDESQNKSRRVLFCNCFCKLRIEVHGPELVASHVIRHAVKLQPQGCRAALP